jgi:hypothetical protein|tara:strand:+ start:1028 stop:1282 length:255 start_codon:yes stop_codon:yes gene_type:complete
MKSLEELIENKKWLEELIENETEAPLERKIVQMMAESKSPKEVCLFSLRIPPDTRYKIKGLKEYLSDYVNSVKLDESLEIFLTK